jgi:hypothetical protein
LDDLVVPHPPMWPGTCSCWEAPLVEKLRSLRNTLIHIVDHHHHLRFFMASLINENHYP